MLRIIFSGLMICLVGCSSDSTTIVPPVTTTPITTDTVTISAADFNGLMAQANNLNTNTLQNPLQGP